MEEFFKWRTSLRIRKCFRFQVWRSKSMGISDNNQSQTGSFSSFSHDWISRGNLGISTDHTTGGVEEDFDIGTQDHQISKCCGGLDNQIEPWQSYPNVPQTLFQGSLYCHVHHLWAGARILWAFTAQFTISNSLTQMPATVYPWHYSLTLRRPLSPDCVNLLIAPWQVLILLFLKWRRSGFRLYTALCFRFPIRKVEIVTFTYLIR